MKNPRCIRIIISIGLVLFYSSQALAVDPQDRIRKSEAFWYLLGQYVDAAIAELDLSANYYGTQSLYPFLGFGLLLKKRHVYTGFRAGLNPIYKLQPEVPGGYLAWAIGFKSHNRVLGNYRFDIGYGLEPVSRTYMIEPRYTGEFWSHGPKHRRTAIDWAISYRYTFRDEKPIESGSLMLHLLLCRYGSEAPVNFEPQ